MTEINNPQLNDFCNSILRTFSDQLARIDQHLPTVLTVYNDRNLGGIIDSAGSGNLITDGSQDDGRTRRVGGDVYNMITLISDLKNFMDSTGRRDVLVGWQVNGLV